MPWSARKVLKELKNASWSERKGKRCSSATPTGTGDEGVCVEVSVVRWQKCANTFRGHCNDSATILDLTLTSWRFVVGLHRNISTEPYYVLIMLTRGRAQQLVLKAAEPEGARSVSTSPPTIRTTFNSHDSFETCGSVGNHVQW